MYELKRLHRDAVPAALEKARRYRLLNEALEAESICLDILAVDPDNAEALTNLVLALSDQFERKLSEKFEQALALLPRFRSEYERLYYEGILCERRAKVSLSQGGPGSGSVAYTWFRQAMERFEAAQALRPEGNDDALLRWNTCARILNRNTLVVPAHEDDGSPMLE